MRPLVGLAFVGFALASLMTAACGPSQAPSVARSDTTTEAARRVAPSPGVVTQIADDDPRLRYSDGSGVGEAFEAVPETAGTRAYVRANNSNLNFRRLIAKMLLAAGTCSYAYDNGPEPDNPSAPDTRQAFGNGVQVIMCGGTGSRDAVGQPREEPIFFKAKGENVVFCADPDGVEPTRCNEVPMPTGESLTAFRAGVVAQNEAEAERNERIARFRAALYDCMAGDPDGCREANRMSR